MAIVSAQLFDTALSPQDQLDEQLAQASLGGGGAQTGGAAAADESPQELAEETFTDLSRASQAQITQERFFDEDSQETIEDQEMASTLVNSVSASVIGSEAEALMSVSPSRALSLLEP